MGIAPSLLPMPKVTLHLYDVTTDSRVRFVNDHLGAVGTGAFHGGVEIEGREWSFQQTPEGTGVYDCTPKACKSHRYRESLEMGETDFSMEEIQEVLSKLKREWPGLEYDLLRKNCVVFCASLLKELGLPPPPAWTGNLAALGATFQDGFNVLAAQAEVIDKQYNISAAVKDIEEKWNSVAKEIDAKYSISKNISDSMMSLAFGNSNDISF